MAGAVQARRTVRLWVIASVVGWLATGALMPLSFLVGGMAAVACILGARLVKRDPDGAVLRLGLATVLGALVLGLGVLSRVFAAVAVASIAEAATWRSWQQMTLLRDRERRAWGIVQQEKFLRRRELEDRADGDGWTPG